MTYRSFDDRVTEVAMRKPEPAAKLVFEWVKTGVISAKEFYTLIEYIPQECGCELCGGTRGGVPGNENVINGTIMCDYCYVQWRRSNPHYKSNTELAS